MQCMVQICLVVRDVSVAGLKLSPRAPRSRHAYFQLMLSKLLYNTRLSDGFDGYIDDTSLEDCLARSCD